MSVWQNPTHCHSQPRPPSLCCRVTSSLWNDIELETPFARASVSDITLYKWECSHNVEVLFFPSVPLCAIYFAATHFPEEAFASWLGIRNEKEPSKTFCTSLVVCQVRHFKTQVNLKEVIAPTADTYTHIWRSPFSIFNVLIPYFLAIGCFIDVQHLPVPFLDDSFTITSPSMLHWQEDANIIFPNLPSVAAENQYHSQILREPDTDQIPRLREHQSAKPGHRRDLHGIIHHLISMLNKYRLLIISPLGRLP